MAEKLIVFDPGIKEWLDNRIFSFDFARRYPGGILWAQLAQLLQGQGIIIETIDRFHKRNLLPDHPIPLIVMPPNIMPITQKAVFEKNLFPLIILCLEPPIIAPNFYKKLYEHSSTYKHIFSFTGASNRVNFQHSTFHPIVWPYDISTSFVNTEWDSRKLITMINSNLRPIIYSFPPIAFRHPRSSIKEILDYVINRIRFMNDKWIGEEFYTLRLHAIKYFCTIPGFDLFGRGWDNQNSFLGKSISRVVKLCYHGPIPDGEKSYVLSQYKFCLCFENSKFPGYITEKILDCFFSGTIPIYLGAPDILDFIPPDTFIDFRKFDNFDQLYKYISSITTSDARSIISSQVKFINSDQFNVFNSLITAQKLLKVIIEL
jgi:hypothetical protein